MSQTPGHVPSDVPQAQNQPRARARRIFVAEDDHEMRRIVTEALRSEGYDVVEAADSTQLLLLLVREDSDPEFRREIVDLIVTDVRMPGCSGLDVIEVLRDANWKMPVIVMTAFWDNEIRARAELLGAVMLEKPFRLDALRTAVKTSLI